MRCPARVRSTTHRAHASASLDFPGFWVTSPRGVVSRTITTAVISPEYVTQDGSLPDFPITLLSGRRGVRVPPDRRTYPPRAIERATRGFYPQAVHPVAS